ncbi:MAG: esterase-like activity of phytase family protein [Rubrivivax sp.]|jgi:hypothetical protein
MKTNTMARAAVAVSAALLALAFGRVEAAPAVGLSYLGQQIVPTGTLYAGTTVGGLSGIDRIAGTDRYLAISDDRSALNPARFYELQLDLSKFTRSATPGWGGVSFTAVTTIQTPSGAAFGTNQVDPESLRINPNNGKLVWSNEGDRLSGNLQNPTVREMNTDGSFSREFAVPGRYNPVGAGANDAGIRRNLAFETLTISTDGQTLYTATENALVQDGPAAGVGVGSPSRVLSFNLATGQAGAEFVYNVDPVALAPNPAGGFATNGLVEMLAVGDRQFIAVERSFAAGAATPGTGPNGLPTGNTIRLYMVDARGATDVSALDSLVGQAYTSASKTLLLDLSDLRNDDGSALALDNIEGITWGPEVNGLKTLVLVSDNNFGGTQFTQFVALQLTSPIPEPSAALLMLPGLLVLAAVRRRQGR